MTRVIADYSHIWYRHWHASGGSPAVVLVEVMRELERLTELGHVVVSADGPDSRAYRQGLLAAYKSHRKEPTPAMVSSKTDTLARVCAEYPTYWAPGYEADDVTALLIEDSFDPVHLASLATDELQLIGPAVTGSWRGERVDAAWVMRRFGCRPDQMPLWQALVGDPSDAIPGYPGIGPVKAARMLSAMTPWPADIQSHVEAVMPLLQLPAAGARNNLQYVIPGALTP